MHTVSLPQNPSGHSAPITHVALARSGTKLASSSYDGSVAVWDTSEPEKPVLAGFLRHRRLVNSSAWNPVDPDVLATASADKTIGIWHVGEAGMFRPRLTAVLARHTDDINAAAWMPDGKRLACVSEDGRATLWDTTTGELLGEIGSHTAHCMAVSISAHGTVATVGEDGLVSVVDPDSDRPAATRSYDSSIEGCAWSHSGQFLALTCDDGKVEILDADLHTTSSFAISTSAARSAAWTEDDTHLVVGTYDGTVRVVSADGAEIRTFEDERLWPRSVDVSGEVIAVGAFSNRPFLFDLATGRTLSESDRPNHGPNALTAEVGTASVGCDSGTVFTFPLEDGPATARAAGSGPVLSLAYAAGRTYAGTYAGDVREVAEEPGGVGPGLEAPVPSLIPWDGGLVAGTYNGDLYRLDTTMRVREKRAAAHGGSIKSLFPFGEAFLSAGTDDEIQVGTMDERSCLWRHGNLVNDVASLGDKVIASGSRDHTVKVGVVDRHNGQWTADRVQTFLGSDESVKAVGLLGTPDRPIVVAGSYDFNLYCWTVDWEDSSQSITSGRVLATFGQAVSCLAPAGDGRLLAAGWDGRLLLIGLNNGEAEVVREWSVDDFEREASS
ncbi:WD40 repeat domain-containing protein [Haloglycomyces albus]|uniref:WD40 repeat domain-containing protein n=1 Tax=Haloglycomyces albus TaxID=526067 RepID=UPI00046CB6F3|nr:WD40 repeat domain-containing protein [Haloglycomyces albus]